MKKLIIGSVFFISSIVLFGMTLISASIYSLYITTPDIDGYIGGYDRSLGVYGTALKEVGIMPLFMSMVLLIAGIYLLVKGWPARSE
ncbi:phosphatase [Fictibacillus sp. b24]|uniref:phosphatase n=1 Tax=Fictibacillus sp. b24 TaxID=3055863 RepID=UPI0025A248BD|nr:phosphatase [Fictibacillus sp. b24]MDM5317294.1 phosphatase [Fictibacillus sp. b24]